MAVDVSREVCKRVVVLRKKNLMSQVELSEKAHVSLRTLQDLEKCRRSSFSEATLIAVCRALEVSYETLWDNDTLNASVDENDDSEQEDRKDLDSRAKSTPKRRIYNWITITVAAFAILLATVIVLSTKGWNKASISESETRYDWIQENEKMIIEPVTPEWAIWPDKIRGKERLIYFNHIHYDRYIETGKPIECELQWSWYYRPPGTTVVFISAYCEWDPENETRIFQGELAESGVLKESFLLPPLKQGGVYRFRVFYTEAFAPIPSFYGAPLPNQVTAPSSSRYYECEIEVHK